MLRFFFIQEYVLELVHPGVYKQERGIILRYQGCTPNISVPLIRKKVEELISDFRCLHDRLWCAIELVNLR